MRLLSQVILTCTVAMAIEVNRVRRQDPVNLDPTEIRNPETCTTKNGTAGICVLYRYCNNDHIILTGAHIMPDELREKKPCVNPYDWCCSFEEVELPPKLNVSSQDPETCTTINGTAGICVLYRYCNNDHIILKGGNIFNFELRGKNPCVKAYDWCCSFEEVELPPKLNVSSQENCLATKDDEHSWFVALFKSPNDNQSAKSLFCSGALVTSSVVLTAGTCLKSAQKQLLYVQVPASKSLQNYTVKYRQLHHSYNSGTHENDFGILVLDKDVDWGKEKEKRICLDFATQSQGDCFTIGFAEGAVIATTLLDVATGACRPGANGTGVSCGTNSDSVCIVTPGAPVLCSSKESVYTVVGVAQTNCRNDKVPIGDIASVSQWLKQELSAMNVSQNIYTYNKS